MALSVRIFALAMAISCATAADNVEASGGLSPLTQLDEELRSTIEIPDDDNWLESWKAPTELRKIAPYYKMGHDEDGSPVYVVEFGSWNFKQLADYSEETRKIFWKYWEQYLQRMIHDGRENGNQGTVVIIDWDGFSLKNYGAARALQMALKLFIDFPRIFRALKYGFMINTNFAAQNFINISKPFIGTILDKYEIYGTQPEKWKPALRRQFPQDQLPFKYGGSSKFKPLAYGPTD